MNLRKLTATWLVALIAASVGSNVAAWEPAKGPLATRWIKDVSPDKVWNEYPRPQMVREKWINLNGLWSYAIRPAADAQPANWDGEILVPFAVESALSGVMKPVQPEERLWYRRTFAAPSLASGQRLLLHFGAVDWKCTVWVNGHQVGEHTGGYDPFTFDITAALKSGANEVVVAVSDPTDTGYQPRGKQVLKPHGIMYTAVTGIWQTVWLEPVPAAYIESLVIVPDVDEGVVKVTARMASGKGDVWIKARNGTKIIVEKAGRAGEAIDVPVPNAELWSPGRPKLYDLQIEVLDRGKVVDSVASYFGMRKIEVKKDADGVNRLWLNNEVLFQYGPLDQGWWPDGLYTPPTDEAQKFDIETTKKLGMNMARKHVKYENARWYYWCDKLGLLVWQDMPSGDAGKSAQSKDNYRRELAAMIDALANHPSIIMWVPFNEGWGQFDTAEVVEWIERYDPTRPVNEASGWHDRGSGTVSDMHAYPGPAVRPLEGKRVCVLGEFGGLGLPVSGHTWQSEKNWGYVSYANEDELTDAYVALLTSMRPLIGRGLAAAVYTQTSDVEVEVNGLMTYDRERVKMNAERIAAAARKLYGSPPLVRTLMKTSREAPQQWRYTTTLPADGWEQSGFDDGHWKAGQGGFGDKQSRGATGGTVWSEPEIWLRRSFELGPLLEGGEVRLDVRHDDDAEVYLNGQLVKKLTGAVGGYALVLVEGKARDALQVGSNVIAVHCKNTGGDQFIDAGLVELVER